jgi:hypothetical protein
MDGDGKPDLAVLGYDEVTVIRNSSNGPAILLGSGQTYAGPYSLQHIHLSDIDVDGKPDILVAGNNFSSDDYRSNFNNGYASHQLTSYASTQPISYASLSFVCALT